MSKDNSNNEDLGDIEYEIDTDDLITSSPNRKTHGIVDFMSIERWDISLKSAILLVEFMTLHEWASKSKIENGKKYYYLTHKKILHDLPILGSTKSIQRYIKELLDKGIIENIDMDTSYPKYRLTLKGREYGKGTKDIIKLRKYGKEDDDIFGRDPLKKPKQKTNKSENVTNEEPQKTDGSDNPKDAEKNRKTIHKKNYPAETFDKDGKISLDLNRVRRARELSKEYKYELQVQCSKYAQKENVVYLPTFLAFINHHKSVGTKYENWFNAFENWIFKKKMKEVEAQKQQEKDRGYA